MLRIPDNQPLTALRDFLLEAGYTSNQLKGELGLRRSLYADLENLDPLLERTSGDALLPTLARLFFVGWPAAAERVRRHIPENILQLCMDANLLSIEDNTFAPAVVIIPFENVLLFVADAPRLRGVNPNIVIGPSSATKIIADCLFREPAESALDIGTGSGVLSVVASAFSNRVIGTDINERAIEFARFSAALNGVHNVEFVAGDAFAPAEGKQFARIFANPPFFLAAKKTFVYSDSPLELDGFTRKLAMEAPRYLEENGVFQMICEWVEVEGEPWEQRLQSWTAGSGCDVFVYVGPLSDPLSYAENRFYEAGSLHSGDRKNAMSDRVNYFREHGVRKVASGVITMRKREGANWFTAIAGDLDSDLGKLIKERVNGRTIISEYTEQDWLQARLRFAPDATITQTQALKEDGWKLTGVEIIKPGAIKDPLVVDASVLRAIELFDGSNTLASIIDKTAEALAVSHEEAKSHCLQLAKRLVRSGFVIPVASETNSISE